MSLRPLLFFTAVLCLAIATFSCGGGSSAGSGSTPGAGSSPRAASPGSGVLIVTRPKGLAEIDLSSRDEKSLIPQPTVDTYLLDPAVSADGANIAYIAQPPPVVSGTSYDAGSDLWIAKRDGTGARQVLAHQEKSQLIRYPAWIDAMHLLVVVQESAVVQGLTSVVYVLEKVDIGTGQRQRIIENVLAFSLSPDRTHLVYTELAAITGESLKSAAIDGSGAVTLVGNEQNLLPFNSPRYSPDGTTIAFASADQTGARANTRLVSAHPLAGDPAPPADGLPEDIWTVGGQGGLARRVAKLKEDLPALTWGEDSTHIYVVGTAGVSDVNLTNGAVARVADGAFHAQIAWAPR